MRRLLAAAILLVAAAGAGRAGPPETRQCVPVSATGSALVPLGRDRVLVRTGPGRRGWVSRFRGGDCPGLAPFATLIVEVQGGQYCSGDRVRALRPGESIPGPACLLGPFERHEDPVRVER